MSSRRPDPLAQVSDFDIRLLRIFRSVVECGGFSAAETVLGIGRSAISQQMSDLEQRLGLRLCQRGRAGFSLTEEGREWSLRAQQVFGLLGEAVEQIGSRRQVLQLKASTCVMRWLLPRLMQWQKERPDVPVELTTTVAYTVDFRRRSFFNLCD